MVGFLGYNLNMNRDAFWTYKKGYEPKVHLTKEGSSHHGDHIDC